MNPLKQLESCGQSPWLDYVRRDIISNGELRTLIERDGLKGVTSNPAIFEKAIGHSNLYDEDLKQFEGAGHHDVSEIYDHLTIEDIQAGADVLRPVYDATGGRDGYISLEVSPYLANETQPTIEEAVRLWGRVDRPNLMVKVPATPAGIPAIRELIGRGLNINVTLLFGVPAYEQVVEAYISGLETLAKAGANVSRTGSVASFFVSRIDSLVDKKLAKTGDKAAMEALRGKVAIANAKHAYERYKALFAGPRWEKLAAAGAKTQRLLWASTSTKDPAFPDTLYVVELIGRDTVNTMPPATMDAFRDHGTIKADAVEKDVDQAHATMATLAKAGISIDEVASELVEDGVKQFADAFDKLLAAVAKAAKN
ncbi:MAG TPA: transaldolase [Acetobacteraceae bacterium]|nr:transaldolase [Acetobacteraceae bacterium]